MGLFKREDIDIGHEEQRGELELAKTWTLRSLAFLVAAADVPPMR